MKICFLDVETTGLDPARDEMIELHCQIWDSATDGVVPADQYGQFYRLWMPQGKCDEGAAKVNGFSLEAWAARGAKPMVRQDIVELDHWLRHHKPDQFGGAETHFDVNFLNMAGYDRVRFGSRAPVAHRQLDIQSLAAPLVVSGKVVAPSLSELCKYFGVQNQAQHTSRGDVDATIEVFERLIGLYWPVLGAA